MKKIFLATAFFIIISSFVFAQEENLYLVAEGKYFSIYGSKNLDILSLLEKINFNYFLHIGVTSKNVGQDLKALLADTLDTLYLEVSDILDIHIYSYHGKIYFFPDKSYVSKAAKRYSKKDFSQEGFYLHQKNAVYISSAELTLGVLAHEVSHAIISHYFVVPPPVKVQEVLAGYVEYSLRKHTGTLSNTSSKRTSND